jgi:peptide/nickel transport system ATP-binding protein
MNTPLLVVSDLHATFETPRGLLPAVRGVSFSVAENQTVGIVGESGSGKTVLARTIMGLQPIRGVKLSTDLTTNCATSGVVKWR